MLRLLLALATVVCATQCTPVNAQGHRGKGFRAGSYGHDRGPGSHRSRYPSSLFGFSIGIGGYPGFGSRYGYSDYGYFNPYAHDPYRYGSFRAPDLLDDPLFIESHRYDSHFPGRRRAPLVVRPAVPQGTYPSYGHVPVQPADNASQVAAIDPSNLAGQLQSASQQLSHSLSTRQDSEAWMEYLAPHRISQLIASGNLSELRELLTHYDGVVGNPQLRSIVASTGFATTRSLLRQYVSQRTVSTESVPAR